MYQSKSEAIMVSAQRLFGRYGLKKASMDEIARKARVTKKTIYNQFGSKDRLYLEVLRREKDQVIKNVLDEVEKESSPKEKLHTFAKAKFRYMRKVINILNLDREGVENVFPLAEDIRNELTKQEIEIIRSIFSEGKKEGLFKIDNILLAAESFAYGLRGYELKWLIEEDEESIDMHLDQFL